MPVRNPRHALVLVLAVAATLVAGCGQSGPTRGFAGQYENCLLGKNGRIASTGDSDALFAGLTRRRIQHGHSSLLGDGSESHWYTEFTDERWPREFVLVERTELPIFNARTGPAMAGRLHLALAPELNATLLVAPHPGSARACADKINRPYHASQSQ